MSCKNYYNDTIEWADQIEIGTDIETVKSEQPSFIEVRWEKPVRFENDNLYEITKIKGNNDVLNIQNFLVFVNGKYQGRESKK